MTALFLLDSYDWSFDALFEAIGILCVLAIVGYYRKKNFGWTFTLATFRICFYAWISIELSYMQHYDRGFVFVRPFELDLLMLKAICWLIVSMLMHLKVIGIWVFDKVN